MMVDTFKTPVFKSTYRRFFAQGEEDLNTVYNATLEVQVCLRNISI